ncbi:MAG: flippase-like domain-containing protein [Solirubrobacterales bacterium]|nr:flippase-like domain-containing protein [Solirubrobacterales bacterium]
MLPVADVGDSFRSFFDAVDQFLDGLADVRLGPLLIGLLAFGIYLTFRARASFHILRAAYPTEPIAFRDIWGAYFAGYGFNAVVPARGGDVVRLFLTKTSIPNSSYPAVASSFVVELGFDVAMGSLVLLFAFTQGVFPKPPDFASLDAFDLSYFASHPRFTLFAITAVAIAVVFSFAYFSVRVRAFWERVRQGVTIAFDRRRYFREVFAVQFVGWLFRCTAFWFLLEAFNVGGSVKNVLLVLGVNAVAAAVPFTPQGAGVAQALLVKVFAGTAPAATVAAYSVGQQIAVGAFVFGVGFAALAFVFRLRSFKEVIARGREERASEQAS